MRERKQLNAKLSDQIRKYAQDLSDRAEDYETKLAEREKKYETTLYEQKQDYESKLSEREKKYDTELSRQRLDSQKKFSEQEKKHEAKILDREQKYANRFSEYESKFFEQGKSYEERVLNQKQRYETQLSEQKQRYESDIETQKTNYEEKIANLTKEHEKTVSDMVKEYNKNYSNILDFCNRTFSDIVELLFKYRPPLNRKKDQFMFMFQNLTNIKEFDGDLLEPEAKKLIECVYLMGNERLIALSKTSDIGLKDFINVFTDRISETNVEELGEDDRKRYIVFFNTVEDFLQPVEKRVTHFDRLPHENQRMLILSDLRRLYRDQIIQLDKDLKEGLISEEERDNAVEMVEEFRELEISKIRSTIEMA